MMKLFLQIFAVIASCLMATSPVSSSALRRRLRENDAICMRNDQCRWAVCTWSQWFTISPENCQFVDSTCRCSPDMECVRTNAMRPGSDFIVFKYRCQ